MSMSPWKLVADVRLRAFGMTAVTAVVPGAVCTAITTPKGRAEPGRSADNDPGLAAILNVGTPAIDRQVWSAKPGPFMAMTRRGSTASASGATTLTMMKTWRLSPRTLGVTANIIDARCGTDSLTYKLMRPAVR